MSAAGGSRLLALMFPLLLLAVTASAIGVVHSSHLARQLFSELQTLRRDGLVLQEDWGRLLLEQSTWASHDRIQRLAEDKLTMVVPREVSLQVVKVDGDSG